MFLKPSSYYKYRGDNLQHSVVNNNEIQSRNPRAVALSTHARLRFSSSVSLLLRHRERQFPAMNILILHFLFWMAVSGHVHINVTFFLFWMAVPGRERINFTSAFTSLLFLFSFHNKNVLFWVENQKKKSISSSMKKKIILLFTFTSFSIQNN